MIGYSPGTKKAKSNIPDGGTEQIQQIQPDPYDGEVVGEDEYVKVSNYISAEGQNGIPVKQEVGSLESCSPGSSMAFQGKVEGISGEQVYHADWKSGASVEENSSLPEQHVADADTD